MLPALSDNTLPWSDDWRVAVWTGSFFLVVAFYGQWAYLSSNGVDWVEHDMGAEKVLGVLDGAGDAGVVLLVGEQLSGDSYCLQFNSGTWTQYLMPLQNAWTSICKSQASGRYIAVAQGSGNVAATTDNNGATWTARALSSSVPWVSVVHNGAVAVAAGGTSYSVSSDDGATWGAPVAFTMPSGYETDTIKNVVLVGSRIVAVFGYCIGTSEDDGATWTVVVGPGSGRYDYGMANSFGVFLPSEFYGAYHFSEDGLVWASGEYAFPTTYDGAGAFTTVDGESTFILIRQFSASYVLGKGFVANDMTAFFAFSF